MSESEQSGTTAVELLLREPEIVAWLDDYRLEHTSGEPEDDEPPRAA